MDFAIFKWPEQMIDQNLWLLEGITTVVFLFRFMFDLAEILFFFGFVDLAQRQKFIKHKSNQKTFKIESNLHTIGLKLYLYISINSISSIQTTVGLVYK